MQERRVLVNKNSIRKKPAFLLTTKPSKACLQVERLENNKGDENNENVCVQRDGCSEQQVDTETDSCQNKVGQEFELWQQDEEKWDQYVEENLNIAQLSFRPDLDKVTQKFEASLLSQGQDPYNMNPRMLPSIDFSLDQQVQNEEDKYWLSGKNSNGSPQKHGLTFSNSNLSDIQENDLEVTKSDQNLNQENINQSKQNLVENKTKQFNECDQKFGVIQSNEDDSSYNSTNHDHQHVFVQKKVISIPLRIPCNNQRLVIQNSENQYTESENKSNRSNYTQQQYNTCNNNFVNNGDYINTCEQYQKNFVQIPLRIPCNNSKQVSQNSNKDSENHAEISNRGNVTPRLAMQTQNQLNQNSSCRTNTKQYQQQQTQSNNYTNNGSRNHTQNNSIGRIQYNNNQQQQSQSKLKRPGTAPCARNQVGGTKQQGRNSLEGRVGLQTMKGRPSTPTRNHNMGGNTSSKREISQQRGSNCSVNSKGEVTSKRTSSQMSITSRQQVSSGGNGNGVQYKQQVETLNFDLDKANKEIQSLHQTVLEKQQLHDDDKARWESSLQQSRNRNAQLQEQLRQVQERLDKTCQELLLYQNRCLKYELEHKAFQGSSKSEVDSFQNPLENSDTSSQLDRQAINEESSTFSCELKDLHIAIIEEFQNQKTEDCKKQKIIEDNCAQNKENCQLVINTSVTNPVFEESSSPKSPRMEGQESVVVVG